MRKSEQSNGQCAPTLVQCSLHVEYGGLAVYELLQALRITISRIKPLTFTCVHVLSLRCLCPQSAGVLTFPRSCVREFPALNHAHRDCGLIYGCFERGRLVWMHRAAMDAIADQVTLDALRVLAPGLFGGSAVSSTESARYLDPGQSLTLGRWSSAMTRTATVATPFLQANQSDDQLER